VLAISRANGSVAQTSSGASFLTRILRHPFRPNHPKSCLGAVTPIVGECGLPETNLWVSRPFVGGVCLLSLFSQLHNLASGPAYVVHTQITFSVFTVSSRLFEFFSSIASIGLGFRSPEDPITPGDSADDGEANR
jgi:hypothetical protein